MSETRTAPASDAPAEKQDGKPDEKPRLKTVRDMLLSLAVVSAVAFGLYFYLPHDASQDPVKPVEYQVEANLAARAAPYGLLAPEGLPPEWRATSVRYQPQGEHGATWRLGFMDPENEYAALAQADGAPGPFVDALTHGAEDTGETLRIDGREWTRYEGAKYDALVLAEPEVTTLVLGTAPVDRLEQLAAALETRADTTA
ncbi:DUF4245 domain-containing protein [Streptomyces sp. ACA25]|uniref:DUF4245 domain-containing protein n=1 Tax=Streptomyces sp. ACA25 TaxID=3022596 RepID=UPI002306FEE9|nr:DUF4245 domain-containing protein [Streptomyces sp. ACA25]MDB1086920.1 DUF4245 domain-containing protein [Streptomyces sp. ACA25]